MLSKFVLSIFFSFFLNYKALNGSCVFSITMMENWNIYEIISTKDLLMGYSKLHTV